MPSDKPPSVIRRSLCDHSRFCSAACAATLLLGCTAVAAVTRWHGFALLDNLNEKEQQEFIQTATTNLPTESVGADGTVTRFPVSTGTLTEPERHIIADGCLINYYRNSK